MTTKQKRNISRGVKLARQRRRRSLAMIDSWKRRKANNNQHAESVPTPTIDLSDNIDRIQSLARLWQILRNEECGHVHEEALNIINGAVTLCRLEIMLIAQSSIPELKSNE